MNILVVGAGRIGAALADALASAGHQVVVVEKVAEVAQRLRERMPGVEVVHGDGDEPVVLERANISRADVVAAMAHEDEDNLVACLLAKREYGVRSTFARVNQQSNEWLFGERFGVDSWMSAERIDPGALARQLAGGASPLGR